MSRRRGGAGTAIGNLWGMKGMLNEGQRPCRCVRPHALAKREPPRGAPRRSAISAAFPWLMALLIAPLANAQDDHGDTPGSATLLAIGSAVAGTLHSSTDADVFRLDLVGLALIPGSSERANGHQRRTARLHRRSVAVRRQLRAARQLPHRSRARTGRLLRGSDGRARAHTP